MIARRTIKRRQDPVYSERLKVETLSCPSQSGGLLQNRGAMDGTVFEISVQRQKGKMKPGRRKTCCSTIV